jgi:nitric oxide reductase subunit C
MLSKSQARFFFLAATGGFSFVFLALTVDTIRQVPQRSNADKLTAEVIRGKEIWEANNCMGCHTLMGEGAYYAPELTKVVERRGKEWIRVFIRDPQAMYPGQRKMVQYDFTEEEITDVIAFLEWVGNIDTNGFPAEPDMKPVAVVAASAGAPTVDLAAAPGTFTTICIACHAVGGKGGAVGPALDGVATRFTPAELDKWLADPQAVKPGTTMPKLGLDDTTRSELVTWLMTLN